MNLMDLNADGSFGKFYGHPDGLEKSKEMVIRILKEFDLDFNYFKEILNSIPIKPGDRITVLQDFFKDEFLKRGWESQTNYPESDYKADYALQDKNRYIFVEIELSDIRRNVNAFYMSRVFRTGYMRLGIYIIPESTNPENKVFSSRLIKMYNYLAPDYPLWVIGFTFP